MGDNEREPAILETLWWLIMAEMTDGAKRIAAERLRQIEVEGYDAAHDDTDCELGNAAIDYILASMTTNYDNAFKYWPWDALLFKPKTPIRDLERAGALIAAEIDRQLRAKSEARND